MTPKTLTIAAATAAATLLAAGCSHQEPPATSSFCIEVANAFTPVKDQGRNPTCWAFAMLAAIETEHIERGDSVNLSPYYAMRCLIEEQYRRRYLSQGSAPITMRGMGHTLLGVMERRGMVPYSSYCRGEGANSAVVARKAARLARSAAATRAGLHRHDSRLAGLLDSAFGPAPRGVYMFGAHYTPPEFARSVCAPGEYMAISSFTHHPFYTRFALETPDNHERGMFLNLPLDSMMAVIRTAVRNRHGVCWEGDISEPGFSFGRGTATLGDTLGTQAPGEADLSQRRRQHMFERFLTTDDHCMAIVGLARDTAGREYFMMKNSWGTANPYGGLMFVSAEYVRMKTIAVWVPAGWNTANR